MKVSRAILSDIPEMNKLVNHAYRGEEANKGWTFDLLLLFLKKESIFLVAKNEEEKLVGSVYLEAKNDNLYLGMLSVEPIWQDKGIGKLLVLNAIETAKSLGLKNIQLQVVHLREELISWYKRLGFVLSDKILPFEVPAEFGKPKVPVHFIEMNYPLIME
jgi:ribosomal protein S18 acetylase RimI-like enzyme